MKINNGVITIDFSQDFDETVEELFWQDMNFEEMDGLYIHDTNQNLWYSVEDKYWYAGSMYIINSGKKVRFSLVDEDFNNELQETYDEDF